MKRVQMSKCDLKLENYGVGLSLSEQTGGDGIWPLEEQFKEFNYSLQIYYNILFLNSTYIEQELPQIFIDNIK